MKNKVLISVILFLAVFLLYKIFLRKTENTKLNVVNSKREMAKKSVVKGKVDNKKSISSYKKVKTTLKLNKDEYTKTLILGRKKYFISSYKRAIAEKKYNTSMGMLLERKGGYVIYKLDKAKDYLKYSSSMLPVLRRKSKPRHDVFTGKIVVRTLDIESVKNYFEKNGFKEVNRLSKMNLVVFKAPTQTKLNTILDIANKLPVNSNLSWETLATPITLR